MTASRTIFLLVSGLALSFLAVGCSSSDEPGGMLGGDDLMGSGGVGNGMASGGNTGSSTGGVGETGSGGSLSGTGGADGSSGGSTNSTGGSMNSSGGQDGSGGMAMGCDNSQPAISCDMLAPWPSERTAAEDEVLRLVNIERARGATCGGEVFPPVDPVSFDETLRCGSRLHSQDMADRSFFSHQTWKDNACTCNSDRDCPSGMGCDNEFGDEPIQQCGKSPFTRLSEVGFSGRGTGENIAAGNATPAATMEQWMNSPGHCRNIMRASWTKLGVGYATGGSFRHYWTQSFGG